MKLLAIWIGALAISGAIMLWFVLAMYRLIQGAMQ